MKEKIKSLSGRAMIEIVKEILERTNTLSKRLQGTPLENLKLSNLSDFEIMSLPEATAIAITDWYYCNKINGLDKRENFKKIITIRKFLLLPLVKREEKKKLDQILEKQPQSLIEFIGLVVEAEHKIHLSAENIKELMLEYKGLRGIRSEDIKEK